MKLIIFILIVLIIAALLIRIILRSVNQHSPLLMQLHAAGIRTGDAERILSGGEYWQRQKTLLDAPRDKCTLSCAINGIHAAFHYLKKNYISGCVMTVPTG